MIILPQNKFIKLKKYLLSFFLLSSFFSFAQFGLIQDQDGFVNVRELENVNSPILAKIKTGTILFIDPEPNNPNWILVEYQPESNGYIYHDRIKNIKNFTSISPILINDSKIEFSISDYVIQLETQNFNSKKHQIQTENGFVYAIDEKDFLGSDGMIPQTEFKTFKILFKGKEIIIPKEYYANLYNVNLTEAKLTYNKELNQYYLFGTFSDGAASFDAIWVLENGKIVQHLAQLNFYA